jgi:hypothetical protein
MICSTSCTFHWFAARWADRRFCPTFCWSARCRTPLIDFFYVALGRIYFLPMQYGLLNESLQFCNLSVWCLSEWSISLRGARILLLVLSLPPENGPTLFDPLIDFVTTHLNIFLYNLCLLQWNTSFPCKNPAFLRASLMDPTCNDSLSIAASKTQISRPKWPSITRTRIQNTNV